MIAPQWILRGKPLLVRVLFLFSILAWAGGLRAQCPVETLAKDLKETNGELKAFLDKGDTHAAVWEVFFKSGVEADVRRNQNILAQFTSDFADDATSLAKFRENPELIDSWKFVFEGTGIRKNVSVLESISTALKRGIKDVPDIVNHANHPNIVAYTVEHIFRGHGNNGGRHHISSLLADPSIKLIDRLSETADGFYEAVIKRYDGSTSTKSFWPDAWNENKIIDELKYVMANNPRNIPGTNNWEGYTTSGQLIRYYVKASDNSIISAFPILQ